LKNLDFSKISLESLARIGGGSFTKLVALSLFLSSFEVVFPPYIFKVNLDATFCLKVLFYLSK